MFWCGSLSRNLYMTHSRFLYSILPVTSCLVTPVRTSMQGGSCKRQLLITRHLVQGQHPVLVFTRLCLDSRPNTGYSDTRCIVNFLSSSMKYSMTASFQSFHSITDAHLQVTHYGKFTSGTALLNEYRNTQRSKTCSFT